MLTVLLIIYIFMNIIEIIESLKLTVVSVLYSVFLRRFLIDLLP